VVYENTETAARTEEAYDMVVLATAAVPPEGLRDLTPASRNRGWYTVASFRRQKSEAADDDHSARKSMRRLRDRPPRIFPIVYRTAAARRR